MLSAFSIRPGQVAFLQTFESLHPFESSAAPALLVVLFGIVQVVFWMTIGWRAMRAHERLADCASKVAFQAERQA